MLKKLALFLLIAAVYVLHQDYWNWRNASLTFGLLPAGLAYHAAYSVVCSLLMAVLVKFAWPSHLEGVQPEPQTDNPSKTGAPR
jgi:hypothetical protein